MNNLEWLIKDKELLKDVLLHGFAVSNGKVIVCNENCKKCDFDYLLCRTGRRRWLEAEHTMYKHGDIILNKQGKLAFVVEDTGKDIVIAEDKNNLENKNSLATDVIQYNDIEKKVGNIYQDNN